MLVLSIQPKIAQKKLQPSPTKKHIYTQSWSEILPQSIPLPSIFRSATARSNLRAQTYLEIRIGDLKHQELFYLLNLRSIFYSTCIIRRLKRISNIGRRPNNTIRFYHVWLYTTKRSAAKTLNSPIIQQDKRQKRRNSPIIQQDKRQKRRTRRDASSHRDSDDLSLLPAEPPRCATVQAEPQADWVPVWYRRELTLTVLAKRAWTMKAGPYICNGVPTSHKAKIILLNTLRINSPKP
jgi:hypothetical protein